MSIINDKFYSKEKMMRSLEIIKGVVGKVGTVEKQKPRMGKMSKVNMASAMALQA